MLRDRLIPCIWGCDSHRYISYLTLICIHRYLPCYTYYLISDTGTCHVILITWYLTPVLVMLYLSLNIWHRYLPCYTYHLISDTDTCHATLRHLTYCHLVPIHLTWYCDTWLDTITPDTIRLCIFMIIAFTRTWLLYRYQTFGTPELLYSELLYSWTPEKGWLLILYSYWSP